MKTHNFESTGDAYDACQCDDSIEQGDILVIASEGVVGVAYVWPFAVTEACGDLHSINPATTADDADFYSEFKESIAAAKAIAATL